MPPMRRRPENTATALPVPSQMVTSSHGLPALGTTWMALTSPATTTWERGTTSAMSVLSSAA